MGERGSLLPCHYSTPPPGGMVGVSYALLSRLMHWCAAARRYRRQQRLWRERERERGSGGGLAGQFRRYSTGGGRWAVGDDGLSEPLLRLPLGIV